MIHDKDRSGWIGASDTSKVMGNWSTETFQEFWAVKLGITENHFESLEMKTGTWFEGKVLDAIGVVNRDRQIKIPKLRLRVNLDGESKRLIHEVKTYKSDGFKVSKSYWQQAQAEMYAAKKPLEIVAYHLIESDYQNWLSPIDLDRLSHHPIDYDGKWINEKYLPRLCYLAKCLKKGVWPNELDIL